MTISTVKAILAAAFFTAFGCISGYAQDEPFTVAGFWRDMDLGTLVDRYPNASHVITPAVGGLRQGSDEDPKDWIRAFIRNRGTGTYVLRLAPGEVHDHLYYVQAEVQAGLARRLWLLFEAPAAPVAPDPNSPEQNMRDMESRYPPCDALLDPLVTRYGKPDGPSSRWEEALESLDYVWTRPGDVMKLECGRYFERKTVFAIAVTLEWPIP